MTGNLKAEGGSIYMRGALVGEESRRGAFLSGGKQGKKHVPATQAVVLKAGE